ncbi:MAG: hypothetical protein FD145_649 [Candidatus Saganbacteria bacterium]|uniref:Isochorismatase family protein n=1 Tax=Candidatus Saganbacteria bacterium TaxID=2575572 RepID=A0A833L1G9_UNCSA|nr:MAG: hypothetical protein FD145_649 [Candidatus Saganbacteria bacterium]
MIVPLLLLGRYIIHSWKGKAVDPNKNNGKSRPSKPVKRICENSYKQIPPLGILQSSIYQVRKPLNICAIYPLLRKDLKRKYAILVIDLQPGFVNYKTHRNKIDKIIASIKQQHNNLPIVFVRYVGEDNEFGPIYPELYEEVASVKNIMRIDNQTNNNPRSNLYFYSKNMDGAFEYPGGDKRRGT